MVWFVGVPLLAGMIAVTDVAVTQSHFQLNLNLPGGFLTQATPTPRGPILVSLPPTASPTSTTHPSAQPSAAPSPKPTPKHRHH